MKMPPRRNTQEDEDFRSFLDEDEDGGYTVGDDDEFPVELGQEIHEVDETPQGDGKVFGMSAGERAFLSVVFFFNVLIMGAALLIVTGRVQLG
jgi:hypothetical protein